MRGCGQLPRRKLFPRNLTNALCYTTDATHVSKVASTQKEVKSGFTFAELVRELFGFNRLSLDDPNEFKLTRPPELTREFIHDCLYNPAYGYFMTRVNLLDTVNTCTSAGSTNSTSQQPTLNFHECLDEDDYNDKLFQVYKANSSDPQDNYHQLWHTPSVLFKPWYGMSIGNYMVQRMKKRERPTLDLEPLIIYEVGPGDGSLAESILAYIETKYPRLFARMEYHLIEISPKLSAIQRSKLARYCSDKVKHWNTSIFAWTQFESRPCFVLGMEVLDNMPHDRVKYLEDGTVMAAKVLTNDDGSLAGGDDVFKEIYEPVTDPLIATYLHYMDLLGYKSPSLQSSLKRKFLEASSRLAASRVGLFKHYQYPYASEFIATTSLQFYQKLLKFFPKHSLIISDFDDIPQNERLPGWNAPRIQTRCQGHVVLPSTYMVKRGLCDIFFQTDFQLAKGVYALSQGKSINDVQVLKHNEFITQYGVDIEHCCTKSGYNPLVEDFSNASFLLS